MREGEKMDNNLEGLQINVNENPLEINKQFDENNSYDELNQELKNVKAQGDLGASVMQQTFKDQRDMFIAQKVIIDSKSAIGQKKQASKGPKALRQKYSEFFTNKEAQTNVFAVIPKENIFVNGAQTVSINRNTGNIMNDKASLVSAEYVQEYNDIVKNTKAGKFSSRESKIKSKIASLNKRWDKQVKARKKLANKLLNEAEKDKGQLEYDVSHVKNFEQKKSPEFKKDYRKNPENIQLVGQAARKFLKKKINLGSLQRSDDILNAYQKFRKIELDASGLKRELMMMKADESLGAYSEDAKKALNKINNLQTIGSHLKTATLQILRNGELSQKNRRTFRNNITNLIGENVLIKGSVKELAYDDKMNENMNNYLEGNMLGLNPKKVDLKKVDKDAEQEEERKKLKETVKKVQQNVKKEPEMPEIMREMQKKGINFGNADWDKKLTENQKNINKAAEKEKAEVEEEKRKVRELKERLDREEQEAKEKRHQEFLDKKAQKEREEKEEQERKEEEKRRRIERKQREKEQNQAFLDSMEKEKQDRINQQIKDREWNNAAFRSIRRVEIEEEKRNKK